MQNRFCFLPHYQLVYINFDFSSFSLISYTIKEYLLPCKRASFTLQKNTCYPQFMNLYYNLSCPCSFHNKRVSLPLHYYNNTIKNIHLSIFLSLLSLLLTIQHIDNKPFYAKMLKVTATKNKTILGV